MQTVSRINFFAEQNTKIFQILFEPSEGGMED